MNFSPKLRRSQWLIRKSPPTPSVFHPSPAIFSSRSSHDSSSILPLRRLLSGWYERMTPEPSGVEWYKVIGRSSPLTGRPLKGHLNGANRNRHPLTHTTSPSPSQPTLPSSSAACVTWPRRGVRGRMINDAFSTCLEWSCPRCTVITHSQAAAAQHNCFLFVDLVYWGERWLRLGEKVFPTVDSGEGVRINKTLRVSLFLRDRDGVHLSLMGKERERSPPLVINYAFYHSRPLIIKRARYAKLTF